MTVCMEIRRCCANRLAITTVQAITKNGGQDRGDAPHDGMGAGRLPTLRSLPGWGERCRGHARSGAWTRARDAHRQVEDHSHHDQSRGSGEGESAEQAYQDEGDDDGDQHEEVVVLDQPEAGSRSQAHLVRSRLRRSCWFDHVAALSRHRYRLAPGGFSPVVGAATSPAAFAARSLWRATKKTRPSRTITNTATTMMTAKLGCFPTAPTRGSPRSGGPGSATGRWRETHLPVCPVSQPASTARPAVRDMAIPMKRPRPGGGGSAGGSQGRRDPRPCPAERW